MKFIVLEIILFKALLLTFLVNAQNDLNNTLVNNTHVNNINNTIKCPPNFKVEYVKEKLVCIPVCKPQCKNAFCSPLTTKCECFPNYVKSPENDYECIEKPKTTTTTTTIHPTLSSGESNSSNEAEEDETNETVTEFSSPYFLPKTLSEDIDNTTEFSNETTTEIPYTTELPDNYNVDKNLDVIKGNISCFNGVYINKTCFCPKNYRFNAKFESCDQDNYYNESLLLSKDKAQINNHSKFFIIGYVILAMILLLAILSVIIIYLLLKDNGSAYNVEKYEKKYGSQHTKRYSDEIELHEIPLHNAKGTDNKYYDAERFLDDRQHI